MKYKNVPPSVGEFAVGERDQLLARVAELEQQLDDAGNWDAKQLRVIHGLHDDIAALKQPSAGVDEPAAFSCEHASCKSLGQHHPLCSGYKLLKAESEAACEVLEEAVFVPKLKAPRAIVKPCNYDGLSHWTHTQSPFVYSTEAEAMTAAQADDDEYAAYIYSLLDNGQARAQLAAPAGVPDGWRLVPVEPTRAMRYSVEDTRLASAVTRQSAQHEIGVEVYAAMLSAAPTPAPIAAPSNEQLMKLAGECAAMPGGSGMLYANYAREVLRRWGSSPAPTVEPAHSDDVSVPRELLDQSANGDAEQSALGVIALRALLKGSRDE